MTKNLDEEKDIRIPDEDDENVGTDVPKKKKRHKSKEERVTERKVIFWTMIAILIVTLGFWLVPKMGQMFQGNWSKFEKKSDVETQQKEQKKEVKNYVEIIL